MCAAIWLARNCGKWIFWHERSDTSGKLLFSMLKAELLIAICCGVIVTIVKTSLKGHQLGICQKSQYLRQYLFVFLFLRLHRRHQLTFLPVTCLRRFVVWIFSTLRDDYKSNSSFYVFVMEYRSSVRTLGIISFFRVEHKISNGGNVAARRVASKYFVLQWTK